jgi:hypothetical protein
MSAASVPSSNTVAHATPNPPRRWIINSWVDWILILLTPLIAIPAVLFSSSAGVKSETIALVVTAFFATGHHLPGLIRAYGDQDLFNRFRWRFLLAPPLVFLAYFPLATYHYSVYRLIILTWATWHGLMQLYGFVRIYDAKAGSVSKATANWDWLLCLCGFITPQFIRPQQIASLLSNFYASGGPWISVEVLNAVRWFWIAFSIFVLIGFTSNYVLQTLRGPKPSHLKLIMLVSGLGLWWYAMLGVEELIIGIALFDICHDVQYLAIVWLYNCRRVSTSSKLGGFMRFVFRRGMVLLYLGLIFAYGAVALTGSLVLDGTIERVFFAVLFTSTILHYYYDGFIWKVRETANQVSLDLQKNSPAEPSRQLNVSAMSHFLKWSPIVVYLGVLFTADLRSPPLTTARKDALDLLYVNSLMGNPVLPPGEEEQSWLYSRFEQVQQVASSVPDDPSAQLKAAIMQANFGQFDAALQRLMKLVADHPKQSEAWMALGGIHLYLGNLDQSFDDFQKALSHSIQKSKRAAVLARLGELELHRGNSAAAEANFEQALQADPGATNLIADARIRAISKRSAN